MIDATGLEARHVSRHYYLRAGKAARMSGWPKLSTVTDCRTHLFLSAVATRGPGHDAGQVREAVGTAAGRCRIDTRDEPQRLIDAGVVRTTLGPGNATAPEAVAEYRRRAGDAPDWIDVEESDP